MAIFMRPPGKYGHQCNDMRQEVISLAVSPAPSGPAAQTPPVLSARTSPRKLAGAYTPLAAPACRRARIDDRASGVHSVHRRPCRVAYLAWAMRWRVRYSTRHSRCGSPCQLSLSQDQRCCENGRGVWESNPPGTAPSDPPAVLKTVRPTGAPTPPYERVQGVLCHSLPELSS